MNKQDKNGIINWADYTWNPIIGCSKECNYCYAMNILKQNFRNNKVHFFKERLKEISRIKNPSKIFICSMGDIYDKDVKEEWRQEIWKIVKLYYKHTFMILTKQYYSMFNDKSIRNIPNLITGITITGKDKNEDQLYLDMNFCDWDGELTRKFISFEPLLGDVQDFFHYINSCEFIIIGSQTKPDKPMKKKYIEKLEEYARSKNIKIIRKNNFLISNS